MVSFRGLFQSESQRQIEAEAQNIGLAHTIRDLITGTSHEAHVDAFQKKKAVKALQKAKPAQVNELISILKAMPDPTVVEFKTVHSRDPSKQHGQTEAEREKVGEPSEKSKDQGENDTTVEHEEKADIESEAIKAPSSWWAVSFSSLLSSIAPPSLTTTTTTVTTFTVTEEVETKTADDANRNAAETSTSDLIAVEGDEESEKVGARPGTEKIRAVEIQKGTITKTTTSTTSVSAPATADESVIVSTLNSIKKQIKALGKSPPTDAISAYTFWWGYEIYVPHNCMSQLQRVSNTSQIFFGFLSGAITGIPGLAALVPLTRIISAWVGFQWAVIQAEDLGKGVVLSATWVLPVALAPRPWDHPGGENDSVPVPHPNQKKIKAKAK
ncbi:hypothetical protein BGZ49_005549 [Haplosporangium sp. Z 27]|nr:hypothetical protein BGZ49_005549 [Haplosporangium sp. Z 27]